MEWFLAVHRIPERLVRGAQETIPWQRPGGQVVHALKLNGADLTLPLPVSFDETIDLLESWNCLLIEPDGSLVWASASDEHRPSWRIDAQLQDGREGLQYVEIKTTAPRAPIRRLMTAFGHPKASLVVQLIHEGVFLDLTTWLNLIPE